MKFWFSLAICLHDVYKNILEFLVYQIYMYDRKSDPDTLEIPKYRSQLNKESGVSTEQGVSAEQGVRGLK